MKGATPLTAHNFLLGGFRGSARMIRGNRNIGAESGVGVFDPIQVSIGDFDWGKRPGTNLLA
jgi:hypothetical protein